MVRRLNVYFLPAEFEPERLQNGIAVIVDILRATTTMTTALANKARGIIACGAVKDALALRAGHEAGTCLLGGERGGLKIDGFDLSNSPDDYARDVVAGKLIGFTTTNGTKALLRASQADETLIGAFVNLSVITEYLQSRPQEIHIVCAGTNGEVTGEDVLFAGALTERLQQATPEVDLSDAAKIAMANWRASCTTRDLETAVQQSTGGKNLVALGYSRDITTASSVDTVPVVGRVDQDGMITAISH